MIRLILFKVIPFKVVCKYIDMDTVRDYLLLVLPTAYVQRYSADYTIHNVLHMNTCTLYISFFFHYIYLFSTIIPICSIYNVLFSNFSPPLLGTLPHLGLAMVYIFLHAMLMMFQATTLNVAFNSHNKALLTIMMSNNFVELKGSVFKKFEKNNLFQVGIRWMYFIMAHMIYGCCDCCLC